MRERLFKEAVGGKFVTSKLAGELNRAFDTVERISNIQVAGQGMRAGLTGAGTYLSSENDIRFLARLTNKYLRSFTDDGQEVDPPRWEYAWVPVTREWGGNLTDQTVEAPPSYVNAGNGGLQGNVYNFYPFSVFPAYEANNLNIDISGNVYVWLKPGQGEWFEFSYYSTTSSTDGTGDEFILARITLYDTSSQSYSWEEMEPLTGGDFQLKSGGRTGTAGGVNRAYERNYFHEVPIGSLVYLTSAGRDSDNWYYFDFEYIEFPAKLRDYTGGDYSYGWVEMEFTTNGGFQVKVGGLTDISTGKRAYERNLRRSIPDDTLVWMRRGYVSSGTYTVQDYRFDFETIRGEQSPELTPYTDPVFTIQADHTQNLTWTDVGGQVGKIGWEGVDWYWNGAFVATRRGGDMVEGANIIITPLDDGEKVSYLFSVYPYFDVIYVFLGDTYYRLLPLELRESDGAPRVFPCSIVDVDQDTNLRVNAISAIEGEIYWEGVDWYEEGNYQGTSIGASFDDGFRIDSYVNWNADVTQILFDWVGLGVRKGDTGAHIIRPNINFNQGYGISITVADHPAANEVDITPKISMVYSMQQVITPVLLTVEVPAKFLGGSLVVPANGTYDVWYGCSAEADGDVVGSVSINFTVNDTASVVCTLTHMTFYKNPDPVPGFPDDPDPGSTVAKYSVHARTVVDLLAGDVIELYATRSGGFRYGPWVGIEGSYIGLIRIA